MGRPSKPAAMLRMEGRSHRTKAELESREKHEKAQLTGKPMKEPAEVKQSAAAHAMWKRVKSLLAQIGRDDALYEQSIGRYCMLHAELQSCAAAVERLEEMAVNARELHAAGELDGKGYLDTMRHVTEQISAQETLKMRKRKMMMDIERENVMTIASSLRSIPKAPEDPETAEDPMSRMLMQRLQKG